MKVQQMLELKTEWIVYDDFGVLSVYAEWVSLGQNLGI